LGRNRRTAKRAVLAAAKDAFARWEVRGEYKDPGALWKSFRRHLQDSTAFDALVSDKRLSLEVIAELSGLLVHFYDDPEIPIEFPPKWEEMREERVALEKRLGREADVLAESAAQARRWGCKELATELEAKAETRLCEAEDLREVREYYERSSPPGQPLLRSRGAPKRPDAAFAEAAERLLARQQPVPYGEEPTFEGPPHLAPPDRHRHIAGLVSGFYRATTPAKIHKLLSDAKRRAKLRREKWLACRAEQPAASGGFYPHPCFVPVKSPATGQKSNHRTAGKARGSRPS
jgi:hypothetical protein